MLKESPHARRNGPRYGILGGTFDPPHFAHLFIAQEALVRLGLDRVYFVPAGEPPHKVGRQISDASHRLAMLERAIAGNPGFAISTIELGRPGPSYTVDTLAQLRAEWGPQSELAFILGWDMLLDLPRWHQPQQVVRALDWVVAIHRPGYDAEWSDDEALMSALPGLSSKLIRLPIPQLGISATGLRSRVASSLPIRYLVPDSVAEYIAEHGLYREAAGPLADAPAPRHGDARGRTSSASAHLTYDRHAPDQEVRL
jgi:nicotinate-nucleotide adenylyltransferase